ncbi:MAG: M1 family metallopeptidase [Acidobacteriota bacterium]
MRASVSTTLAVIAVTACSACGPGTPPPGPAPLEALPRDVHSYARPAEARVTHVSLDLRVDFSAKRLGGQAALKLRRAPQSNHVVLDTRRLNVHGVADGAGRALTYALGNDDKLLGRPLDVTLPAGVDEIVVSYDTMPEADALQWLSPAQTAGKKHPYLFSQGEAILTRTWIPTQDSPGIRQTYSARIVVPQDLKAVMSAEQLTPDGVETAEGRAFEFRLTQPVPPYLFALAVGDLQFRPLGPRTGVYAEPAVVESAAAEFQDAEKMVAAAESLLGPYRWGRFDVLVLPPSFPFGGMENPRLTFATPTVLAGDRSLVSLIAHELAHSWSGNLVTNATWSDFWLNEGVTSYVELRIMEALYGPERAAMLDVLARQDLIDEIARLGGPTSPETILHINLDGRNPDDGATGIPYDKGAALMRLLEKTAGRERFDAYLRSYIDRHAFQSIVTATFAADVRANLIKGDAAMERAIRLDDWLYQPGLPDNAPAPRSDALERAGEQARRFGQGTPARDLVTASWTTQEWQHFLDALPLSLSDLQMTDLDRAFGLTGRGNSEILFTWLGIAIKHHYRPALPALERFLTMQGRRKFLRPLYEGLMATAWGRDEARRIYARARPTYHAVASTTLDAIVR